MFTRLYGGISLSRKKGVINGRKRRRKRLIKDESHNSGWTPLIAGTLNCVLTFSIYPNILMLKTDSKSQLIPTNRIAAGTTILIHQYRKRGKGFALPSVSSFNAADLLMHQAAVMTANNEPKACMPDPKVKSQGKNILKLIMGGIART